MSRVNSSSDKGPSLPGAIASLRRKTSNIPASSMVYTTQRRPGAGTASQDSKAKGAG